MAEKKRRGVYTLPAYAGWTNQQLTKNCGLVPYLFHKYYGFHAVMAGAKIEDSYPYMKYVSGMDVEFLPDGELSTKLDYIDAHAEDMDLLILHGYYPNYEAMVKRYREHRPDGKIYLERDLNSWLADRTSWRMPNVAALLDACDVIGVAGRSMQRYIARKCPYKIEFIPNGFYNFADTDYTPDFAAKENIILTVGRIGLPEKNNDLLLEAFDTVADELPDWSLRVVGGIEAPFRPYVESYFARFPALRERVSFTGLITDRNRLAEEYKRAKIFVLTSIKEGGTPNVIAEALSAGDYIVTSSIDAAADAVDEGRCGEVFPIADRERLANVLAGLTRNPGRIAQGGHHAVEYAGDVFDYGVIVRRLYYLLYGEDGI